MENENVDELLLRKEAAQRKRKQLRDQGIVEDYTNELKHRHLVIWKAMRGQQDEIENFTDSQFVEAQEHFTTASHLSNEEYDFLADKMVADATNGTLIEIETMSLDFYAKALESAAVEVEAKLLQLESGKEVKLK